MDGRHPLTPPAASPRAPPGEGVRPCLILMIKPPEACARAIDDCRRVLGIDRSYGVDRLHTTLLPLGPEERIGPVAVELVRQAAASLAREADPFPVLFEKLRGNALAGGRSTAPLRAFQRRLVRRLAVHGIRVPDYRFRPHLSLVYGEKRPRNLAVPPVGWTADEYLLVRSIVGRGRHEIVDRWKLRRRQGELPF